MIKIYGYSDDLFEVEGDFVGENEYPCYETPVSLLVTDREASTGAIVTGEYGKRAAVWTISVEPVDEGKPIPPMSIKMGDNGYTPMLVIECSETSTVEIVAAELKAKEDE